MMFAAQKLNVRIHETLVLLTACFLFSGCTSITSSGLLRSVDGKFYGDFVSSRSKGVPCKVKVQTHVYAEVKETLFIDDLTGKPLDTGYRIRYVQVKPEYTDQVVMVHVDRPLAGTLDLGTSAASKNGYSFDANGNLVKLGSEINDQTIQRVTGILGGTGVKKLFAKTGASSGPTIERADKITNVERTIAYKRFSISECGWSRELSDWANSIIGDCYTLCPDVCPAGCNSSGMAEDPVVQNTYQ